MQASPPARQPASPPARQPDRPDRPDRQARPGAPHARRMTCIPLPKASLASLLHIHYTYTYMLCM